ncbi:uncharacterized protein LOC126911147 [Spodoptera frugiperda]|uniref:Uncharacterized protein LOC126911147 n=1 Tax=Spodoptera frugiperda TaxID=7108 RepID=A0A9R0DSE2_SPOFR|nr:uncharacterized protein LOC126911147 [Spodoptera frugiperda]
MSRFIDTGLLVDAVQCKPCLWDVSNCNYKNKDAVARAWEDICDEMFEGLSQEEKPKIVKDIKLRWRTARDGYIKFKTSQKSTPSGSGAKPKKKFILAAKMVFLDKVIQNQADESLSSPPSTESTSQNLATQEIFNQETFQTSSSSSQAPITQTVTQTPASVSQNSSAPWLSQNKRKRQQPQQNSDFDSQMLALLNKSVSDIDSDDLCFFQSLGPIIKKFTTYQKLLFRSEVLNSAMSIQLMSNSSASPLSVSTNDSTQIQPGYQSTAATYTVQPSASPLSVSTNDSTQIQPGYQSTAATYTVQPSASPLSVSTNDSTQIQPGYQSTAATYTVQPSASPLSVSTNDSTQIQPGYQSTAATYTVQPSASPLSVSTNDSTQIQPGYQSTAATYTVQPSASPLSVSTNDSTQIQPGYQSTAATYYSGDDLIHDK